MNRKVLLIAVALMAVAMLATPVLAAPTQGQKMAIEINWTIVAGAPDPWKETGNVRHRTLTVMWNVELDFLNGTELPGNATTYRKLLRVPQGDEELGILNDYYVLEFVGYSGTFEGNALLQSYAGSARLCHALLQGTGDFEGHTINAQHDWRSTSDPIYWPGYLLKP